MLNTAIVGLGNVAKWHHRAIDRTDGVTLTAVVDVDESVAQRRATAWDVTPYTDIETLLATEPVDWAHVCTPLASHADLAQQCLEAGAHVLLEKPMTATRQEYESLVDRADQLDRRVTVVHNQVNYPPFVRARRLVESGRYGELHGVSVRWLENNDPREPGRGEWVLDLPGGEFGEGIVHPIYVGLRMAGHPANEESVDVQRINTTGDSTVEYDGIGVSYTTADNVVCTIQHHSNVPGCRQVEYFLDEGRIVADIPTQSVSVHPEGYDGYATVDNPLLNAAWWSVRNATTAVRSAITIQFKHLLADLRDEEFTVHDTHTPVIQQEADAIRGTGDEPTSRAEADWTNRIFTRINGDPTT
jgi:predicted dehydrogenase